MSTQAKVAPRQVAAYQSLRPVTVDASATWGAQIGVNLLLPDGTVGTVAALKQLFGGNSTTVINGQEISTTDDLPEGQFNWYGNVTTKVITGTTYTAGQADNDTILRGTNDSGLTITVPAGACSTPDVTLYACQGGNGAVAFVAGSGVTFLPSDSAQTRGKGSVIGLKLIATDTWEPIGDLAYFFPSTTVHANPTSASAQPIALQATADKQVLKRIGTALQWVMQIAADVGFTPAGALASTDVQAALQELDTKKIPKNLLTAVGDLIVGGTSGTPQRLASGAVGQVPTVQSDGSLAYQTPPAPNVFNRIDASGDIRIAADGSLRITN